MLTLRIQTKEFYDETLQEFITEDFAVDFEHSLVSLSKWEQFFKIPFLTEEEKTEEQIKYYIQCMVLTPDVPTEVIESLSASDLEAINAYMNDKATATWFNETRRGSGSSEVLTNELIYYWMFSQGIDKECENWHLNRLITLLKIFNFKNAPAKKETPQEARERSRRLNAERRKMFETPG